MECPVAELMGTPAGDSDNIYRWGALYVENSQWLLSTCLTDEQTRRESLKHWMCIPTETSNMVVLSRETF